MSEISVERGLLSELLEIVNETRTNCLALNEEACKLNSTESCARKSSQSVSVIDSLKSQDKHLLSKRERVRGASEQCRGNVPRHNSENLKNKLLVDKAPISTLATEISQMRENLPRVLNRDLFERLSALREAENACNKHQTSLDQLESEKNHWRSRCENALADLQKEKEESLKLKCEVQELTQQLAQQSEYSSSMGATCCTLLWRVSRCEESIESLVMGTKINEFYSITSSTIESYLEAYCDGVPEEKTEETQFVLALCGIITNMAASAIGREELIKNEYGRGLVDTLLNSLSFSSSNNKTGMHKMKNLILMTLYNLSINQKGLKYIATKSGIMGVLSWLLSESNIEIKLNALRLIQSLICDENNLKVLHELQENLTLEDLHKLSKDTNKDVRELSLELVMDIETLKTEQES